jgi:predicted AlkP superfamily pyrophosphatase or phosphodiesterase
MADFYDDHHSLVNVSNSLLKYFSVPTFHETDSVVDSILMKNPRRKVCVILLDGFGKYIQERYSSFCPFIHSHVLGEITSVFPPTTVAATTSLLTGRYPNENGWVGWTQKFDIYPCPLVMFHNCLDDGSQLKVETTADELCPKEDIFSLIRKQGYRADEIQSFKYPEDDIPSYFHRASKLVAANDFSYVYHTSPDGEMHEFGVDGKEIAPLIASLDKAVMNLVNENPDTLFLLLADHGHRNAKYFEIEEHEDFFSLLEEKYYAIEARAASFFVKEGKKEEFLSLAKKYYGEHFYIFTGEEVLSKDIFGHGENSPRLFETIGDFLLVSKDESAFFNPCGHKLLSTHAGTSLEERMINLSFFNLKK